MCKIDGQSIFKWMFATPIAVKDEVKRKQNQKVDTAKQEAKEVILNNSKGDEVSQTASVAKINGKKTINQTLSSLRVPLQSNGVGASVGSSSPLGLNLGG